MKVLEPIQARGYFWLPQNPEKKLPGELHISDFGQIELNLMGVLDNPERDDVENFITIFGPNNHEFDRLYGKLLDGKQITLLKCYRAHYNINFNISGRSGYSSFNAEYALVGANLQDGEATFSKLEFSVEGLDDWLNFDVFEHKAQTETVNGVDRFTGAGAVEYVTRSSPSFNLNNGIKVLFRSPVLCDQSRHPTFSLSLKSQPCILLVSDKPKDIRDFIELADIILKFIALAVDQEVQFQSFILLDDSLGHVVPVQTFFQTRASRKPEYKPGIQKVLFTLTDIENMFEATMNAWFRLYEQDGTGPALNLYFAAAWKETEFVDTGLLLLSQAIEVLHRKTFPQNKPMDKKVFKKLTKEFLESTPEDIPDLIKDRINLANNPSLRDRVKEMMMPFENWFRDNEKSEDFAKSVSKTRNYLTHYSSKSRKNDPDINQLMTLHTKLETLLLLHLLKLVGFTEPQISQTIDNSRRLSKMLRVPKTCLTSHADSLQPNL